MSGYYGYPSIPTGYCVPTQQLPPSAMASTVAGGYPMMAPTMPQVQPPMPALAPPVAPYIPAAYSASVYGSAVPVQPMAYPMAQQQQQVSQVYQQPVVFPSMPPLPSQPPPLPPQQQQQTGWQPVQSSSIAPTVTNYQPVSRQQHQPQQFQQLRQPQQSRPQSSQQRPTLRPQQQQVRPMQTQHQQQIRPGQTQQQQQIRPMQTQHQQQIRSVQTQHQQQIRPMHTQHQQQARPVQTQQQQQIRPGQIRPGQTHQQRPLRNQQQQQQFQRPQLRPRVPTGGGPRGAPAPAAQQLRPPAPRAGAAAGSVGRMRPPTQQKQHPPPLFGKTNLRPVVTAGTDQKTSAGGASKSGSNSEEALQHCPPIPGAVGTEYVVQIRTEQRGAAALQYHCRLCDCRFIDIQARDLHVKGRRHRMQYKRKVDPRISVDAKPGVKARPGGLGTQIMLCTQDSVAAATAAVPSETAAEATKRRRREEEQRMRDMLELESSNFAGCKHGGFWGGGAGQPRRPESNDDRQVLAKHSSIYPTEAELHAVQHLVTRCERALKLASDHLSSEAESSGQAPLRGVMRVGALAKGLLLHGDLATQLVLLCGSWPTRDLRDQIVQLLPERLEASSDATASSAPEEQQPQQPQQLQVRLDEEEGCIIVQQSSTEDDGLELTCSVYLTSPAVREETAGTADNTEPEGALDRDKCLEALAALRQAKWFQAKASSLQSCVPVIRVMRDMCQRLPIWGPLPNWAMELLVERCISSSSGGQPLSPGEAIRRVMECLASGILLPAGPGLRDPCEKAPVDAAASMSTQEREDITASAQQALRLVAFRQLHRVLDMAPLVPPPTAAAPAAGVPVSKQRPTAAKRPSAVAPTGPSAGAKQPRVE